MLDAIREKKTGVKIMLGLVIGVLSAGMLLYLVPGPTGDEITSADVVAQVGDQTITTTDVQTQLNRIARNGQIPATLLPLYAQQVLEQLLFQKSLNYEAQRLGLRVTDDEHAERLRQLVPTAYSGDTFIGMDRYTTEVETRYQMEVPEFETLVKDSLLEQKFQQLVTDGINISDREVQEEYRRRNEKIKIDYVMIKPDDLQAKIQPSDAELATYFEKNKGRYVVPERRTVDYAMVDFAQLGKRVQISDDEIKAYYQAHLDRYKLEDRAQVSHILFKTIGKTDAEVAEIRKKAEDVLAKAKHGAKFADLAKQYSEDTTKDKGGDLGWIVRGQTVPEFEAVAFSLPKGSISDLVKTQYGFHIIQVNDRETARTQTVDEVKPMIVAQLQQDKAEALGENLSGQIAEEIRRTGKPPLADLAKKFDMTTGEAKAVESGQPLPELGTSPDLLDNIFRMRAGDVSAPVHTDRGYVVVMVKDVQPAHPATLAEVRDHVLEDYRHEQAVILAKTRADEFAKRAKSGESMATIAKSLGMELKTSALFSRSDSVPDAGSAKQFIAAFTQPVGTVGYPVAFGTNWMVYRDVQHDPVSMDGFAKQKDAIETQLLQAKRQAAYEAFRTSLEARLRQEGKLKINEDNLKKLTSPTSS